MKFVVIFYLILSPLVASASQQQEAINAIQKASYQYFGIQKYADNAKKWYLDPYVSKGIQSDTAWLAGVVKMIQTKSISFKFTFP